MSNVTSCTSGSSVQPIGGTDNAADEGVAMHAISTERPFPSKTENPVRSTGTLALTESRDNVLGPSAVKSDDAFNLFESRPKEPFSKSPPQAVKDIYQSLPSVANFFPQWPFHPLELPKSQPKFLDWEDEQIIKDRQRYNLELTITRVHAPGTAAHRLLNHSFKQDVIDFSAEFESFRRNGFQTLPEGEIIPNEKPTPYIFGVFKCSICEFSPRHDDIPNWLYLTKVNDESPRYYYCASCKDADPWVQLKAYTSIMGMVKEIVTICKAEENAKKLGMDGVITSVPLARFKRYNIMFNIEVEAAKVRRALAMEKEKLAKEADELKKRQLEKIPMNIALSFSEAAAKEIVDRYFTTEIPELFNTGPLGQVERLGSKTPPKLPQGLKSSDEHNEEEQESFCPTERSHTPPGWPKGYIPPTIAQDVHHSDMSQTLLGRPSTPVWFSKRQTDSTFPSCSTTPPGFPKGFVPSASARSTTPPGYPTWYTPQETIYEASVLYTGATTSTSSTARSSAHSRAYIPFRDLSVLVRPEDAVPGDQTPPEFPEGIITWLSAGPDNSLGLPNDYEPSSSARSSQTLSEDHVPLFDGAFDTPSSSTRSSITLPEDYEPLQSFSASNRFNISSDEAFLDEGDKIAKKSLRGPDRPLRRSQTVGDSLYLLRKTEAEAELPSKAERTSFYKIKTEIQSPPGIGRASFYKTKPEAGSSTSLHKSFYKTKTEAKIPPKTERKSFYKCKNSSQESLAHISQESLSSIPEERFEDHPESDFSDVSADWDSDDSFDQPPRRLRCLEVLDDLIPPLADRVVALNNKVLNSRPMTKRSRGVDLTLDAILEDSEPEEEPEERGEVDGNAEEYREVEAEKRGRGRERRA